MAARTTVEHLKSYAASANVRIVNITPVRDTPAHYDVEFAVSDFMRGLQLAAALSGFPGRYTYASSGDLKVTYECDMRGHRAWLSLRNEERLVTLVLMVACVMFGFLLASVM